MSETKKFKTEIQQLLNLVVHSLYSNKEIFLRELIANSADAIDKARFEALKSPDIAKEWKITIEPNKTEKTLKITDNGIGMDKDEVVANIGTIAKSGTKAFLSALKKNNEIENNPELIGQFGVGFYSTFMVADKVVLETKRAGKDSKGIKWTSDGKSSYTIEEIEKAEQGTSITLYLNEEAGIFLDDWKIKEIVKKYSDFIEHPIVLISEEEGEKEEDEKEITEKTINTQKAIWLRAPKDISEEDHKNFFEVLDHFGGEPLKHIQISAEGTTEFKALLYIPSKAPLRMFAPDDKKHGLHLYVKRVFISDECKELLPDYLKFVKGVVDASDLPLNVSREILQANPQILKINKNLVRKILGELKKLKDTDIEKYNVFYKEFGNNIKEGVHSDFQNKEKLQELLMFQTMNNESEKYIFLDEYCTAMPESQKYIYYITGESREVIEKSPHLEILKEKGYDVLLMPEPIDEFVVQSLTNYKDFQLKPVGKGELELDEESNKELKEKTEKAGKEHEGLIKLLQEELDDDVKIVRFSGRLTESPCCLVSDAYAPSPHMERLYKAMNQPIPKSKRILELNPDHPIINGLQNLYDKDAKNSKLKEFATLLYDQALLTEGSPILNPAEFAKKITNLMVIGLENDNK